MLEGEAGVVIITAEERTPNATLNTVIETIGILGYQLGSGDRHVYMMAILR